MQVHEFRPVLDVATMGCFLQDHEMRLAPKCRRACRAMNAMVSVSLIYLRIHFTAYKLTVVGERA